MQINKSGGLGSNNFLFGDLNLKQRNRKKMCNATICNYSIELSKPAVVVAQPAANLPSRPVEAGCGGGDVSVGGDEAGGGSGSGLGGQWAENGL